MKNKTLPFCISTGNKDIATWGNVFPPFFLHFVLVIPFCMQIKKNKEKDEKNGHLHK